MKVVAYQNIVAALLQKHYSLQLNDTDLHDENTVAGLIDQGIRPYETINEHAEECDLDRIDIEGFYGVPSKQPLTYLDEKNAILSLMQDLDLLAQQRYDNRESPRPNEGGYACVDSGSPMLTFWLTVEEADLYHQFRLALPSNAEEIAEAKARIKQRIANRRNHAARLAA